LALPPSQHGGNPDRILDIRQINKQNVFYDFAKFNRQNRGGGMPERRKCSTMEMEQIRMAQRGAQTLEDFEDWLQQELATEERTLDVPKSIDFVYTLPTVIHVIYSNPDENISTEQILSQLEVLNQDFRRRNPDTVNTSSKFRNIATDTRIEFCLASVDPSGNPTDGIDRISISGSPFSEKYINEVIKPNTIWNPKRYFNLWVCNISDGILGYAQFPSLSTLSGVPDDPGSAETDGVAIHYRVFGTQGTVAPPFNGGRTATHEIGHWLGLRHVWGDGDCDEDDYCADTPPTDDAHYGCPDQTIGCDGPAMVENFMDYTNDECMNAFTVDQMRRMWTVLENSPRRKELFHSPACNASDIKPLTTFSADVQFGCSPLTINFTDDSKGNPLVRLWSFPGGYPESSNETSPTIQYEQPGVYPVTLTTKNLNGAKTLSQRAFIKVSDQTIDPPFILDFEQEDLEQKGCFVHNPNQDTTWKQRFVTGGFGKSEGAIVFENFHQKLIGSQDWLILPMVNLSSSIATRLSFDLAYAQFSNKYKDSLGIFISTGCGDIFQSVYMKGGKDLASTTDFKRAFVPFQNEWKTEVIDLSEFDGAENIQIAFVNISGYGNNIFLDNIKISAMPKPKPDVSFQASTTEICAGEEVRFTDISSQDPFKWKWSFPGGFPSSDSTRSPSISYPEPGVYNVTLSATNISGSNTITQNKLITVKPGPEMKLLTSASETCVGSNIKLAAVGAESYEWFPEETLNQTTGSAVVATPMETTTYMVVGTATNGCQNLEAITINVDEERLPEITPQNPIACAGQTIEIEATGAKLYQWEIDDLTTVSNNVLRVTPEKSTVYTLHSVSNSGCSFEQKVMVTVSALPVVNVKATKDEVCPGEAVSIEATGAASYLWDGNDSQETLSGTQVTLFPKQSTTYKITGINDFGCTQTIEKEIIVNPKPQLNTILSQPEICQGDQISINASGANQYKWSPTKGILATTENSIIVAPQKSITYSLIGTNAFGCSDTTQTELNVHPKPDATIMASASAICGDEGIYLTAEKAQKYTWVPNRGLSANDGQTVFAKPVKTTTYRLRLEDEFGCADTGQLTLLVADARKTKAKFKANKQKICVGESIEFTDLSINATKYQWAFEGATTAESNQPNPIISYDKPGTYPVTLYVEGCSGIDEYKIEEYITVAPIPNIELSTTEATICRGKGLEIQAQGADQYFWYPDIGLSHVEGADIIATPQTSTDYKVTGITKQGCQSIASVKIKVKGTGQTIQVNPDIITSCAGKEVQLSAKGAAHYNWVAKDNMRSAQSANIVVKPTETTTYLVEGIDIDGCKSLDSVQVIIKPGPQVAISADTTRICRGGQVILTASGANSYKWSPDATLSSATGQTVRAMPQQSLIYKVIGEDANGCTNSAQIKVDVQEAQQLQIKQSDSIICRGKAALLSANGGSQYLWYTNQGTPPVKGDSISVSPNETTTYRVTSKDDAGCLSVANTTLRIVAPEEQVNLQADKNTVCPNETVTLYIEGAQSYQWISANVNESEIPDKATAAPKQTTTYSLKAITKQGCEAQVSTTVSVYKPTNIDLFASAGRICKGESVTLSAKGGQNYRWNSPSGLKTRDGNTIVVTPPNSTTYRVTAKDKYGCSDTASINIYVSDLEPDFKVSKQKIDIADANGSIKLENTTEIPATWEWDFGDGGVSSQPNPNHIYTEVGTYRIRLTAVDQLCEKTVTKDVLVENSSSIEELMDADGISISSVPTLSGKLSLELASEREMSLKLRIVDAYGKTALADAIFIKPGTYRQNLDLSEFPKGVYYLQITDGEEFLTQKIVFE